MKRNIFLRSRRALLFLLWLSLGLAECLGDDTNRFPNALTVEQFVWNQLTNQEFIDLSAGLNPAPGTNRTVRGKFLEWLLTAKGKQLPHVGLRLKNAVIEGPVDLSNVEVPVPVRFVGCHFTGEVTLSGAHFSHDLSFSGSVFDSQFNASALRVDGSLELKTFELGIEWATGSSNAPPYEADLKGYLRTNQTIQSWSAEHDAFSLGHSRVARSWTISDPRTIDVTNHWINHFKATSSGDGLFLVQQYDDIPQQASDSVMGLTVGPHTRRWPMETNIVSLDLDQLRAKLKTALDKDLDYIQINVLTTNATYSVEPVRWLFNGVRDTNHPAARPLFARWSLSMTNQIIGTNLTLTTNQAGLVNQTITTNQIVETIPIVAPNQTVTFSQPTIFRQGVWLNSAVIGGKLDAGEVEFHGELYCHGLKVGDDLVMNDARFEGPANFIYATITHDFGLQNSVFHNFDATGMSIGGSLIIDGARFSEGARFDEVSVGKAFKGQYVRFENRNALAEFRGLKVDGFVDLLRAQFSGPANFILSHIKGNFQAHGATFEDDHSFQELQTVTRDSFTFNTDFGSMTVDGFAIFENALFARSVSFRNAQFGNFYLDGTHWPDAGILMSYTNDPTTNDLLRLEGMDFQTVRDVTSGHFLHTPAQLKESQINLLAMFKNRSPYSFDIYAKLESYFRREGAPALADEVFVHAKKREGIETRSLSLAWFANKFLDVTVGYGRKPLRAFVESLAVIGLWAVLCRFYMVKKKSPGQRPDWGLVLFFSLGTFLPITDLGTKDLLDCRHGKEWFRYWIALEKILGYILVPLWTLALAGLVR